MKSWDFIIRWDFSFWIVRRVRKHVNWTLFTLLLNGSEWLSFDKIDFCWARLLPKSLPWLRKCFLFTFKKLLVQCHHSMMQLASRWSKLAKNTNLWRVGVKRYAIYNDTRRNWSLHRWMILNPPELLRSWLFWMELYLGSYSTPVPICVWCWLLRDCVIAKGMLLLLSSFARAHKVIK